MINFLFNNWFVDRCRRTSESSRDKQKSDVTPREADERLAFLRLFLLGVHFLD